MGTRSSTFFASRCSLDFICVQAGQHESAVVTDVVQGTQRALEGSNK